MGTKDVSIKQLIGLSMTSIGLRIERAILQGRIATNVMLRKGIVDRLEELEEDLKDTDKAGVILRSDLHKLNRQLQK